MRRRTFVAGSMATATVLGGCAQTKFLSYSGPPVTHVVVNKGARRMYLLSGGSVLEDYDIALGFAPEGDKKIEGDGRTPEGTYIIDRRNPNSDFHLSIGVSYPNEEDIAEAQALGESPGGDIFIHGQQEPFRNRRKANGDWTWGCIAVSNREMEQIYAMVRDGTPITINP